MFCIIFTRQAGRQRGLRLLAVTVLRTDWDRQRSRETDIHAVWQQGSLITTQDEWHWARSSFRKTDWRPRDSKILWLRVWPFGGQVTSSVTWLLDLPTPNTTLL